MVKKLVVAVVVVSFFALLYVAPVEAGGPKNQNQYRHTYSWAVQMVKAVQERFCNMFAVSPAGWGPADGTGNDGDGPEDGTGYGPGNPNYKYQKYGNRVQGRFGYRYQRSPD